MADKETPDAAVETDAVDETTTVTSAPDAVSDRLTELGVADEDITKITGELGVTSVAELSMLTEADLRGVGMKTIPARTLAAALVPTVSAADPSDAAAAFNAVLPVVPDFESLTDMLRAGGVLKVEASTVVALVQASIAQQIGLFDLPNRLANAMLEYARENDEPVDPLYYNLKKQLTRRSYGDLFAAIEGFDGRSVTEGGKKELFNRVEEHLWPAVGRFSRALASWMDSWVKTGGNPAILMQTVAAALSGGPGAAVPAAAMGMAPDTGGLRDMAEVVNEAANRVFAGEGVQIAAAVAYEAAEIQASLSNPRLPAMIGAANREQMLKQLGVTVSAADPRFERNVVQFVQAVLQVKNLGSGDELNYFNALYSLGEQIPWDQLGVGAGRGSFSGIGGRADL